MGVDEEEIMSIIILIGSILCPPTEIKMREDNLWVDKSRQFLYLVLASVRIKIISCNNKPTSISRVQMSSLRSLPPTFRRNKKNANPLYCSEDIHPEIKTEKDSFGANNCDEGVVKPLQHQTMRLC